MVVEKDVSVSYKGCKPRYFLMKSKLQLAQEFKEKYNCSFSTCVIILEIPQNAFKPDAADVAHNSCPIHSDIWRMVKAANKHLKRYKPELLPTSVGTMPLINVLNRQNNNRSSNMGARLCTGCL